MSNYCEGGTIENQKDHKNECHVIDPIAGSSRFQIEIYSVKLTLDGCIESFLFPKDLVSYEYLQRRILLKNKEMDYHFDQNGHCLFSFPSKNINA